MPPIKDGWVERAMTNHRKISCGLGEHGGTKRENRWDKFIPTSWEDCMTNRKGSSMTPPSLTSSLIQPKNHNANQRWVDMSPPSRHEYPLGIGNGHSEEIPLRDPLGGECPDRPHHFNPQWEDQSSHWEQVRETPAALCGLQEQ